MDEAGAAEVVEAVALEDLCARLEPTASPNLTPLYLARISGVTQPSAPSIAQRAWMTCRRVRARLAARAAADASCTGASAHVAAHHGSMCRAAQTRASSGTAGQRGVASRTSSSR
jgi:hypothetical protein